MSTCARHDERIRRLGRVPSVSVVIPTLNEAKNLAHVLPWIPDWVDEVIIVDGLSVDDTVDVALQCLPNHAVGHDDDRGKGAAIRAGFEGRPRPRHHRHPRRRRLERPRGDRGVRRASMSGADVAMGSRFALGGGTSDMDSPQGRKLGAYEARSWSFSAPVTPTFVTAMSPSG